MATYEKPITQVRVASGLNLLLGLWMIVAPWALGHAYFAAAAWDSLVVGLAVAILSSVRIIRPLRYEAASWGQFLLGLWLLFSPFFLGYSEVSSALWNHMIAGPTVIILAAWGAASSRL